MQKHTKFSGTWGQSYFASLLINSLADPIQALFHLPSFFFFLLPHPFICSVAGFTFSSALLGELESYFIPLCSLFLPFVHAWNPLLPPQLKTTLCSGGSGQASLSQQSQLVSAKLCVSPEASLWQPHTGLTLLDPLSLLLDTLVCFLNVALQLAASSGRTSRAWYLLLRFTLAVFSVHLPSSGFEWKDFHSDFAFWLVNFLSLFLVQSASSAADQGELVSRIKSLELENQSLNKGWFVSQPVS